MRTLKGIRIAGVPLGTMIHDHVTAGLNFRGKPIGKDWNQIQNFRNVYGVMQITYLFFYIVIS